MIEEKARDSTAQQGEYSQKTSSVHSSLQDGTMPVLPQRQNNFAEEMGVS